jgi:hypothetical protein
LSRLLAASIAVLCGACASEVIGPSDASFNYRSLVDALKQSATVAETSESVGQPSFKVPGRIVRVEGEDVQIFEYGDAAAAQADAQLVSADGGQIGTTSILWVAPPHFYRRDRVIALYVGSSVRLLDALRTALGAQFAGR